MAEEAGRQGKAKKGAGSNGNKVASPTPQADPAQLYHRIFFVLVEEPSRGESSSQVWDRNIYGISSPGRHKKMDFGL